MATGTDDKTFVDTNVLISAHDVDAGRKREIAKDLRRTLWAARAGILSTQVLQEFYVNATRKIPEAADEARGEERGRYVRALVRGGYWDRRHHPGPPDRRSGAHRVWDALILAVAAHSGARRVVSEDLNAGQSIAVVMVHNPFTERAAKPRR